MEHIFAIIAIVEFVAIVAIVLIAMNKYLGYRSNVSSIAAEVAARADTLNESSSGMSQAAASKLYAVAERIRMLC